MIDTSTATTTGRKVTIVVNTRPHEVDKDEITFEEVVRLAYNEVPSGDTNISYTVSYRRGHGNKPSGALGEGESVKVKEGMVFNVTRTDKS